MREAGRDATLEKSVPLPETVNPESQRLSFPAFQDLAGCDTFQAGIGRESLRREGGREAGRQGGRERGGERVSE